MKIFICNPFTHLRKLEFYTGILCRKYPIIISFPWSVRELHCNQQHNFAIINSSSGLLLMFKKKCRALPWKGTPHAPKHTGSQKTGKHCGRKGFGCPGGHWVEHEPANPPSSKEGQQPPGLHWEEHHQQAEGGDSPPLVSTGEAHEECLVQFRAPQEGQTWMNWRESNKD